MLTKDDKNWIVNNFATSKELYLVRDELKNDISEIKKLVESTHNAVDKFTGNVATLVQENKMGALTLRRHGVQIHELATATGVKLSQ
jgi:hypothetical protein